MPELPDRFLFEIEGLSQVLRVVRFTGHEALSELFRFDVIVACEDPAIEFDPVIGKNAVLTMRGDEDESRFVHGTVARFEQGDFGKKLTTYLVTVVPRHWLLEHRRDCRIFQEKTAPEIIKAVFEAAGLAAGTHFRLALQGTYRAREYCVQYRESDFAFVSRLMEDEGIYYFFEHEEGKHVMVLGDSVGTHGPIPGNSTVVFRPPLGALKKGEHISRFHYSEAIFSGKFSYDDYDFKKPAMKLEKFKASTVFDDLEIYDYPGEYESPGDGQSLVDVRLQERQAQRKIGDGESALERMIPGHTFTLAEHGRESFNREWLVLSIDHQGAEPLMMDAGESDVRYENRFRVMPSDVPFRPLRTVPKPSVRGVQSAIVTGPPGEEIHTDEHGRVKVHFHWDRLGPMNDKSSCWIRVSQVWAGEGWGAMHIPRVNQEVLVDFVDGDPDRPIVVGRVYHGTNVPPYALPGEKTKSTIKSNSTPGGGGSNELRFEDKKGSEEVYLHAQKDWTIAVENDKNQTVGHDETLKVGNDKKIEIVNDQSEKIGRDETFEVVRDRTKKVGRDEKQTIGQDRTVEIARDATERIGRNQALTVGKDMTVDVTENRSETIGKTETLTIGKDYTIAVTGNMSATVDGSETREVKGDQSVTVTEKIVITCGSAKVTIEKSGDVTVEGAKLAVKASGDVKLESSGKVDVTASGDVKVQSSGKVEIQGSGPMDLKTSGPVKIKGANVGVN